MFSICVIIVLIILLSYNELFRSLCWSLLDVEEWFSLVEKIKNPSLPPLQQPPPSVPKEDSVPPIRWRKGDLIGCGTFRSVYLIGYIVVDKLYNLKLLIYVNNCLALLIYGVLDVL